MNKNNQTEAESSQTEAENNNKKDKQIAIKNGKNQQLFKPSFFSWSNPYWSLISFLIILICLGGIIGGIVLITALAGAPLPFVATVCLATLGIASVITLPSFIIGCIVNFKKDKEKYNKLFPSGEHEIEYTKNGTQKTKIVILDYENYTNFYYHIGLEKLLDYYQDSRKKEYSDTIKLNSDNSGLFSIEHNQFFRNWSAVEFNLTTKITPTEEDPSFYEVVALNNSTHNMTTINPCSNKQEFYNQSLSKFQDLLEKYKTKPNCVTKTRKILSSASYVPNF